MEEQSRKATTQYISQVAKDLRCETYSKLKQNIEKIDDWRTDNYIRYYII